VTTTDTSLNTKVQELIEHQVAQGQQIGVQVCAYKDAQPVVNTWAGQLGPDDPRPVGPDTLFSSFSTTKGVAATALHILADRGLIDYDAPVAQYWPAFAQSGKERITVAQAMSHQAGLHAMPDPCTVEQMIDWQAGLDWIASGTPAWEPGTATGYHGITYAWVVGGIVQGATGRHIKDVIREEIAEPLGIAGEMFVGIPEGVEARLATLNGATLGEGIEALFPPDHDIFKAMPLSLGWPVYNEMRVRQACLPSANGHFSARALAKMYAALANGGAIDGVRLVSPERIGKLQRILTEDTDRVLMMPIPRGVGFTFGGAVGSAAGVFSPRRTAFGHSGAGGSTAFADPDVNLAIAVTINQMQMTLPTDGPTYEVCRLISQELGVA
jgi:CubicO group peptidase (beta-lactamase class C family)